MLTPASTDDLDDVLALYGRSDPVEFGSLQIDAAELTGMLAGSGVEAVLLRGQEGLRGYAHLEADGQAETIADPGAPGVQDALLDWVLERARGRGLTRLEHWAGPRGDSPAANALRAHGFTHVRTVWHLARPTTLGAEPVWPDGVRLREFDREHDAREVHALVQGAFAGTFGSHPRTFEDWSARVLDGGADLLAAEQDGALVAVLTRFERLGDGYVGQLAVDAPHRGRGTARALLQEAFRRDDLLGRPRTTLGVDGENAGARRLYEGVGMHVVQEFRRWERGVAVS